MAQFYKPQKKSSKPSTLELTIESLDHQGLGVGKSQGKAIFVPQVLPAERVKLQLQTDKKNYAKAKLLKIIEPSAQRVTPPCPHYAQCGGCDLQHLSLIGQRAHKQQALTELLSRSFAQDVSLSEPLLGEPWHYRRRARLATWHDKANKKVKLGFRQSASHQICEINQCAVLAAPLSALIEPLRDCLNRLQSKNALGHVELLELVSATQSDNFIVLRITQAITEKDLARLQGFEQAHRVQILLQTNEGDVFNLQQQQQGLSYVVAEQTLQFKPGNFIQVNAEINEAMVKQAIDWLAPKANEQILDLFCGVGNFSLPLAATGARVIGVEGVEAMVEQANRNAAEAGLENLQFYHADLNSDQSQAPWLTEVDKVLLDPARAGALEAMQWLIASKPKAVLYVSCNPLSLARDAKLLLDKGYRLEKVNLLDMFPQTHHMESMALFIRHS